MNGKFLLDTTIVIPYLREDRSIRKRIAAANEIFIPCIVIGELYFGAFKSHHREGNLKRVAKVVVTNAYYLVMQKRQDTMD